MRVVVTGIAGLLGSHVARKLLDQGHEVVGIDNLRGGYLPNVPIGAEFHEVDGRDRDALIGVMQGADVVFHAACTAHEGLSVFSPHHITSNTFALTASVASAALSTGVRRFVQCSSMARYGSQEVVPFHEDQNPRPQDPYAIAKVAAEQLLLNMSETHGMDVVILVPHNIYGPGQVFDDPFRNVAAIMVNRVLHNRPPIIYGDGSQVRCLSYIDDAVSPILTVIGSENLNGEVINIGPDSGEVTIRELAERIASLMDWQGGFEYFPGRPREVHHATCSAEKARSLLGYEAHVDLDDGLRRLIDWIAGQPRRDFNYLTLPIEIDSELVPVTWKNRLM